MGEPDEKLIEKYFDGDERALEKLIKKYLKPIYNFLYSLTGERAVLDDLTQVAFIKAWKNIRKFDPDKNFKTWLFTIAKNTAYDHMKKKKTIPFSRFLNEEGNSVLEEIEEDKILPDEILNRKDLANELEEKLEKIPAAQKTILILHYKEDFSLQEIAEIFKKPYNTIKSQHNRALAKLRKQFADN